MGQTGAISASNKRAAKRPEPSPGRFFARPTVNGKQIWHKLGAETFQEAKTESELTAAAVDAARRGLTVTEAESLANQNRISIRYAVDAYLDLKRSKRPKTVTKYTNTLNRFIKAVSIRFLDRNHRRLSSQIQESHGRSRVFEQNHQR